MQCLGKAFLHLIDRRFGLGAMNAEAVEIAHHLLDHLQRIGYITTNPPSPTSTWASRQSVELFLVIYSFKS
jgi:hypothetical protein